jgi:hypothetical protein
MQQGNRENKLRTLSFQHFCDLPYLVRCKNWVTNSKILGIYPNIKIRAKHFIQKMYLQNSTISPLNVSDVAIQ